MRYHIGLGVGHVYTQRPSATGSNQQSTGSTTDIDDMEIEFDPDYETNDPSGQRETTEVGFEGSDDDSSDTGGDDNDNSQDDGDDSLSDEEFLMQEEMYGL
jgi:hypothetical protein